MVFLDRIILDCCALCGEGGALRMKRKLLWKFDMLIYRLFYWRWSPRLKADPDLAYVFSKIGSSWTNSNPPRNPAKMDQFICDVFAKHNKKPSGEAGDNLAITIT
jgi:hypothetical protein